MPDVLTDNRYTIADLRLWVMMVLSLLVYANLNGILESITGRGNLGSPLILLCAAVLIGLTPIYKRDLGIAIGSFAAMVVLYGVMAWSSGLWYMQEGQFTLSDAKNGSRQLLTSALLVFTYYAIAVDVIRKGQTDRFLFLLLFIFLITLIAGISEDLLGLREVLYRDYRNTRALGFFGNPNETGMQAALTFVLASWLYAREKIGNLLLVVIIGLSLYGVVVSFSRTAIMTYVLLLLVFAGYLSLSGVTPRGMRVYRRHWALLFLLFTGIYILFVYVALPFYEQMDTGQKKRIDAIGQLVWKGRFDNQTTALRAGIFEDALERIKRRPLTGYGMHTFSKGGMFPTSPEHGVHNMYLKIVGEAGLIPLILYLAIVLSFVVGGVRIRGPEGMALLLFGLSIGVYSLSSHGVFSQKFVIALWGVFLAVLHTGNIHSRQPSMV